MKITIEQVDNGYIVSNNSLDISEQIRTVHEHTESEFGDIIALQGALYEIIEAFGCVGSKHDAKRLRVEVDNEDNQ